MFFKRRYLLCCLLLMEGLTLSSQGTTFRSLSVTDGLSDLVVNKIYKDASGYVWIGTNTTIERFDGIHLKLYPFSGQNDKLKRVFTISERVANEIWVGNGSGLWKLDRQKDSLIAFSPKTINFNVYTLCGDKKGKLFIGSEKGIFIYDRANLKQYLLDANIFSQANIVRGLVLDGDEKTLWISTEHGLYSMDLASKKIRLHPFSNSTAKVPSFYSITRIGSTLYMGTMGQGIVSYNTQTGTFSNLFDFGYGIVTSLSSDGKDMLYVATDGGGVFFISTRQHKIVRSFKHELGNDSSIRSNSVYSLLVDRDGLIWIGLYQLGLDYTLHQNNLFSVYQYPSYFDSRGMTVRSISFNQDTKVIGTRDGLFFIDEKNKRTKVFKSPEIRSNTILSSKFYNGEYYVGTYGGGMYVLNPSTLAIRDFNVSEIFPFVKGHIFCIKTDSQNNLWVGTSSGLYCFNGNREVYHFTSINSKLPEGNVYEVFFDSNQKGWICTENGICIWDSYSKSLRSDVFPNGFINKEKVRAVYEDSGNNLYFIPDEGDLFISNLTMTSFRRVSGDTPLSKKTLMSIVEDKEKWLWITTNNGIYRYDKKYNFVLYNFSDGIPSPIFINCFPFKDDAGGIWFGNSKGLLYVNPLKQNAKINYTYPIQFTDVYTNGNQSFHPIEKLNDKEYKISLESSQKNITIYFSGFTFTDPSNMSYEYKLNGKDSSWKMVSGKSEASYYDLPTGTYQFTVRRVGIPDTEVHLTIYINHSLKSIIGRIGLLILLFTIAFLTFRVWDKWKRSKSGFRNSEPLNESNPAQEPDSNKESPAEEKYKTNRVTPEECRRLLELLEEEMQAKKTFTNPNLKIADLATSIGTSPHALSYLFNQYLQRNYYDFINDYRIAEFERLISETDHTKYTLSALSEMCGFSSRASFFRSFKKAKGQTPNEYIKHTGNQQNDI